MTRQKPSGARDSDQSERFRRAAQELIDAGELDPIAAGAGIDELLSKAAKRKRK